jgi:Protein of unknown function (DUF1592)/Protein of unknown function (DUF1588)/PA14 domain/Protein of unknown function (DUF1585)/Cytochrome C oxidase, cbb3-type, subunit III
MKRTHSHVLLALVASALLASPTLADNPEGQRLYVEGCIRCHGKVGVGTKKYPKALVGEFSIAQLADQVQRTMPEDDPGSLKNGEALKIATYMHESFYGIAAQERNRPARVELARLTVEQYRHALADLITSFRGGGNVSWWDDKKRGLAAEYFKKSNYRETVLKRDDAEVDFNFAMKAPVADKGMEDNEFSIRWTGSLLAPTTGDYRFVIKSSHAMVFFLNTDWRRPTLDARVQSGADKEYTMTTYLIGGRTYPIQLEFAKGLVANSKKDKPKPAEAYIHLSWQPPLGTLEPIPARNLSPQWSPIGYICETPFPADDSSRGWERGTSVSKAWEQATTDAAITAANSVSTSLNDLAGIKDNDNAEKKLEKTKQFVRMFAKRAFRKPITDDVEKLYLTRPFETVNEPELAAKRAVLLILKSPRFLYREVNGDPNQYDIAARLAFAMWDSLPDEELLKAASMGNLKTADQVRQQAWRMSSDTRFRANQVQFLHHWLKTDHGRDATKDLKKFPGFDAAAIADLRTSLDLSLSDVIQSEKADFRQLLLSEEVYLNARLAKLYGAPVQEKPGFTKVKFEADRRSGVLTHPFILATFAYTTESSPIHRGVLLAKGILGTGLKPPQDAFSPLAADLHPTLTTRERVILQTKGNNCQSCHAVINELGFTLEHFDAIGQYRSLENKKPVDASGSYLTRDGKVQKFTGAKELAKYLAASSDVHTAFVEQLFHHVIQQPIRAYGANRSAELVSGFAGSGFNIKALAVEIASSAAMNVRSK